MSPPRPIAIHFSLEAWHQMGYVSRSSYYKTQRPHGGCMGDTILIKSKRVTGVNREYKGGGAPEGTWWPPLYEE